MSKSLFPRDICRGLMGLDAEQFPPAQEYAFQHVNWAGQSAYGLSAVCLASDGEKEREITIGSQDCFNPQAPQLTPAAVFNIASITKPFTVATILRMIESEEFAKYFPEKLNTKLSSFGEILKKRYPHSNYVNSEFDKEDARIELKDIIMHISGIGEIEGKDWYEKLAFPSDEDLAKPIDGKFLETKRLPGEYGVYQYSDVGYELLGMIISAIASDAKKSQVEYGEMVRELVISRLGLTQTFTADQLSLIGDEVKVADFPAQKVAQAYACKHDGTLVKSLGFRRCMSTSGIYSNPSDLCKFTKAVFDDKTFAAGGLFEKQDTIDLRNSFQTNQCDQKGAPLPKDWYGIGYMFYDDKDGRRVKYHGATTSGYSGRVMFQMGGKTSCCLMSCQQLTPFFAKAVLDSELAAQEVVDNDQARQWRLQEINKELLKKYTKEELVGALKKSEYQMRFGAECEGVRELNNASLLRELRNVDLQKEAASLAQASGTGHLESGSVTKIRVEKMNVGSQDVNEL